VRYYPVFLDLRDQPCTVLGGGRFGIEKAEGLLNAGARVRVISPRLDPALRALVDTGIVEHVARRYRPGDLAGARLAIDATGDPDVNARSWNEAEAAGIPINVVDVPSRCRFIAPAIVDRDPLLIAISTSGESPFLASSLRARLERTFGQEWGPFVATVGALRRRLRAAAVPLAEQTPVYRRLLRSSVRRLLRDGRHADAEREAETIAFAEGPRRGQVALVGAGPGRADLLTVAARDLLAEADVVFHDALVHPDVLAFCGPGTEIIDVGKRGGRHSASQAEIEAKMVARALGGDEVVRLKGGDPFVFGRGAEEVAALAAAGVDVVVVAGVSSAIAAPAAAGVPVTHRGAGTSFAVATATSAEGGLANLAEIALHVDTLVVLMGATRLDAISAALTPVLGKGRPCALVASATLPEQLVVRSTLGQVAEAARREAVEAPATLVIGPTVEALPVEVAEALTERTATRP
jgi:uroporphyrin-III C-methyltransferase / precorrin-2 dehydrogenase / sirohydrochlorin ferrochelatase